MSNSFIIATLLAIATIISGSLDASGGHSPALAVHLDATNNQELQNQLTSLTPVLERKIHESLEKLAKLLAHNDLYDEYIFNFEASPSVQIHEEIIQLLAAAQANVQSEHDASYFQATINYLKNHIELAKNRPIALDRRDRIEKIQTALLNLPAPLVISTFAFIYWVLVPLDNMRQSSHHCRPTEASPLLSLAQLCMIPLVLYSLPLWSTVLKNARRAFNFRDHITARREFLDHLTTTIDNAQIKMQNALEPQQPHFTLY